MCMTYEQEELDFQGFVTSDWAAVINGVQTAIAGLDMNMPGFIAYGDPDESNPTQTNYSWWGSALIESVNNGSVPQARLDDMVTRTMAAYFKMGQDSEDYPEVNFSYLTEETYLNGVLVNEHVEWVFSFLWLYVGGRLMLIVMCSVQGDHYKVIREIGSASTVLLKNNNATLPLSADKIKRTFGFTLAYPLSSLTGLGSSLLQACSLSALTLAQTPMVPTAAASMFVLFVVLVVGTDEVSRSRGCDQGTLAMGWG